MEISLKRPNLANQDSKRDISNLYLQNCQNSQVCLTLELILFRFTDIFFYCFISKELRDAILTFVKIILGTFKYFTKITFSH